jgi:transcription elongation factor GreB
MSKAFTREQSNDSDDGDDEIAQPDVPVAVKNYIRASGLQLLKDEFLNLMDVQRPEMVKVVSWAASNGDRSENGDYLYGKKRLREIDRRIRFLTQRIDCAVVVDPNARDANSDQIFFGASIQYLEVLTQIERVVTIVGIDEVNTEPGLVSWISPVAGALIKAREGDLVQVRTPAGLQELEILSVSYEKRF